MKTHTHSTLTIGAIAASLLALASTSASAQLINVQFGALTGSADPAYVGQGVLTGGTFWNQIPGATTNTPLLSDSDLATGVTLSTSSIVTYDQQATADATLPDALLQNIVYTFQQQPVTVTVSGLVANMAYDVVAYNGGNPTDFSLNGSAIQEVQGTPYTATATFVNGSSYTEFTGTANAQGSLILVATIPSALATSGEVDISGLQIGSVPEPTTFGLAFIGFGLFVVARRFSKIRAA